MTFEPSNVVVVGSGPTGLVLAAELALGGAEVLVVDRRPTAELAGSRAGGFHSRTIELLDQRGVADRFLAEGTTVQVLSFGSTSLDVSGFPTRHPYTLGLWQNHIERILLGWVEELGVSIRRGVEVTGLAQDEHGVDLHVADGEPLRAAYIVGADGGRSVIRRSAGIEFPGADATRTNLVAEVEVTEETPTGVRYDEIGVHGLGVLENGHTVRVVVTERELGPSTEPSLADLSAALREVYGTDFGVHDPTWISRFSDATRQAAAYRDRRVLLAGDAAHVHPPSSGQGIGLGVQDAMNLGWKLAQVVGDVSSDTLLDTYQAERHPATARVLGFAMAVSLTQRADARTAALKDAIDMLLAFDAPRDALAGLASGLDVAYDVSGGHPLLGRRVPDLDLVTADGPTRVFELLHQARPVLLDLGAALDPHGLPDRVRHVPARCDADWVLPVVGPVRPPAALLVRPDGHVAWVGDGTGGGLSEALARWC